MYVLFSEMAFEKIIIVHVDGMLKREYWHLFWYLCINRRQIKFKCWLQRHIHFRFYYRQRCSNKNVTINAYLDVTLFVIRLLPAFSPFFLPALSSLFWSDFTFILSAFTSCFLATDGSRFKLIEENSRFGMLIRAEAWVEVFRYSLISSSSLFRIVCPWPCTLMDPTPSFVIRFPLECFSHSQAIFPLGKWHLIKEGKKPWNHFKQWVIYPCFQSKFCKSGMQL